MKTLKLTIGILATIMMVGYQSIAQQINGKIVDDNNEAVPFANILLLTPEDSSLVNGTTSNIDGIFLLPVSEPNSFLLKISVMGLADYFKPISQKEASGEIDLGVIKMETSTKMLDAVEVKAQRPQFITYANKVVMDVENTSLHDGTTALDAISKSPGVWVNQNGEISINGKKGARIMIDGRPTYVSGDDLKSMLAGMSAESIKNIEVISNPSAKYDAEGAGGVININIKRITTRGLSGSVFSNYRFNGTHATTGGINLSGKKNGLGYFMNIDGGSSPFWRDMETRRTVAENDFELNQHVEDRRGLYKAYINTGIDYKINDAFTFGINYRGTGKLRDNNWDTESNISEGENTFNVNAYNDNKVQTLNHTLNGFFNYKISDISEVSVDASYADLNTFQQSVFQNYFYENGEERYEELSNENESFFNIESVQIDYETDLKKINTKLEAGLKYSKVTSSNSLEFYLNNQEGKIYDKERSNQFEYKEQINAAYVDFSRNFSEKTTLKAGLRVEHTLMKGKAVQSESNISRNFVNFFPSVFLQHKWTDNYTTNLNYSKRISRPPYIFLNPSIMYTDPYSYIVGNPDLRSKYTDGITFTQVFAEQFNLTLGYDRAKDFIGEIPKVDPSNNNTIFFIGNIDQMEAYNISVLAPIQITDFWQSNTQMTVSHKKFSTVAEGMLQLNQGKTFNMRSTHSFNLPNEFKLELLAAYQSPEVYGLYNMEAYWFADISVKKSFLNDKLDVSAAFNDIFRSLSYKGSSLVNENVANVEQYQYQQGIRLNLRYKFSLGDKFKSNQKKIDLEELQRAGGG